MLTYTLFILGFVILIKGADLLVDGASSMAKRLHVPDLAIGLTVVAFGTSTPELFVNLMAGFQGNTDIAIGNVLGSNIANVLLILGISAVIYPLSVSRGTVWKEIPFSLLAAVVLGVTVNDAFIDQAEHSTLGRIDGIVFICFFIIFIYYSLSIATAVDGLDEHVPEPDHGWVRATAFMLLGLAGLALGGKWIVDGAIRFAVNLGLSESMVGLTIVAVGTSLPELATSVAAALKKNVEIAVGNVVGSNIFNIFFILGLGAVIEPLPFKGEENADIGVVIVASLLLFFFMFTGKKRSLDRWEGIVFIGLYGLYLSFLVLRNYHGMP